MHNTALIANGQIDSHERIRPLILRHPRIVAVDGGLIHCQKMGIQPHLIVGDFDSCPPALLEHYRDVPKITLHRDKDETDLESAIKHEGAKNITLYAAWGGRIDHSLANALLLTRWPVEMETENERVFVIDKHVKLPCSPGQTVSLIPLNGDVLGITTKGLKWELKNSQMSQHFMGVSNICLGDHAEISVQKGSLLCCLLKEDFLERPARATI